jgi:hypothetical protein
MKISRFLFSALLIFIFSCAEEKVSTDLASQMLRLKTNTAFIVTSRSVQQYPLWSPDSAFLAVNISGTWYKFAVANMLLKKKKWGKKIIGTLTNTESASLLRPGEINEFRLVTKLGQMELRTENGDLIQIDAKGFSATIAIVKPGIPSQELWSSRTLRCHDLALSPDERFVAYVCDDGGVVVTKLN